MSECFDLLAIGNLVIFMIQESIVMSLAVLSNQDIYFIPILGNKQRPSAGPSASIKRWMVGADNKTRILPHIPPYNLCLHFLE